LPIYALFLSTAIDCLLGLIYFGSAAAFNSFTGVTTICLSTSYAMPVLVSVLRGRQALRKSPLSFGGFGLAINMVKLFWICLAVVIFSVPTALPAEPETMNYASVVFAFFASISIAWYFIRGRKSFTGPPVPSNVAPGEVSTVPGLSTIESNYERNGDTEQKVVTEGVPEGKAS
jgi:amino acid transporter